jgi:tetratricopeptide (TPR) repeat protein
VAAARARPNLLDPAYSLDTRTGFLEIVERGLTSPDDGAPLAETVTLLLVDAGLWRAAERRLGAVDTALAEEVRGRLALRRGDAAAAVAHLERAATARARSARTLFHLARAAHRAGRVDRAAAALAQAAKAAPQDLHVQVALGDLALERGDLAGAELAFGYALSRGRSPRAEAGMGRALELSGDLAGAERHLGRAVAAAPADPDALERLAGLLERDPARAADARALRRRQVAATKLDADLAARVAAFEDAARAHAAACALVSRSPAEALAALAHPPAAVGRAAPPFARAAAHAAAGRSREADAEARRVLATLDAASWARGARPVIAMSRDIGDVRVVRSVTLDDVPLR